MTQIRRSISFIETMFIVEYMYVYECTREVLIYLYTCIALSFD